MEDHLTIREGQLDVADTKDLPPGAGAAVAAIEKGTGGLKVKFYDKLKALELMGKHLGLFDGVGGETPENNLLEQVLECTKEDMNTDAIREIQLPADAGDDLVESAPV